MNRPLWAVAAFAALGAAGVGGFASGWPNLWPLQTPWTVATPAAEQANRTVIYYQDPDDRPFYALTPNKTGDGREFRPVLAGQDLSFNQPAAAPVAVPAPGGLSRRVLHYRNPNWSARHLAGAEEGFDGDGLYPRL